MNSFSCEYEMISHCSLRRESQPYDRAMMFNLALNWLCLASFAGITVPFKKKGGKLGQNGE